MTDELQQPMAQSQSGQEKPLITPNISSLSPKKTKKSLWIVIIAVLGILCIGSIICVSIVTVGAINVNAERAPVESILDTFMKYMVAKDVESAYNLLSSRTKRQYPMSKFQEMVAGNNYVLFEGYQNISIQNLNLSAAANTNPNIPQGTVAKVTGIIKYKDNVQGSYNAVLEKVDGKWQLDSINVYVPPSKFGQ